MSTTTMYLASKLGMVVTYNEKIPPIKSHDPSNMWSRKVIWQIKKIALTSMPMATKLGKMVPCSEKLVSIKVHDPKILSCEVLWQIWIQYISTSTRPIASKRGKVSTNLEWFSAIKSHDRAITWSHKIIWQIKNVICLLPQCLWPPNVYYPQSRMNFQTRGRARSHCKFNALYLYFQLINDYQTCEVGFPAIEPNDPLILWYCQIALQTKEVIYPFLEDPWTPN